jgi:GNAT superfamily N-acetyltransferase
MDGILEATTGMEEKIELGDGTSAVLRPICESDAAALRRFHAHLSTRSIHLRYFYPHVDLQDDEVTHLTQVDGLDRFALVVEHGGELVAVGRYDRLGTLDRAEVAFVVTDEFQHRGIATLLLQRLAASARRAGITRFAAEVLSENSDMLSVFRDSGFPATYKTEWGTVELAMDIAGVDPAVSGDQTGTRQRRLVPPPRVV